MTFNPECDDTESAIVEPAELSVDKPALRILATIPTGGWMSASQINEQVPYGIATVYRKLDELGPTRFVETDRKLTDARRRATFYQRAVDQVIIEF